MANQTAEKVQSNKLHAALAILLVASLAGASELPNAPHLAMRHHDPVEIYSPDERLIVHNSPSRFHETPQHIFDRQFLAIHAIHAGALATDLYYTERGVSNGCAEASSNLGPNPSTGRIVGVGLAEFGGVLALDAGMKALARNKKLPRWVGNLGGSIGAGIGTFKHVRGAMAWTRTGCL